MTKYLTQHEATDALAATFKGTTVQTGFDPTNGWGVVDNGGKKLTETQRTIPGFGVVPYVR